MDDVKCVLELNPQNAMPKRSFFSSLLMWRKGGTQNKKAPSLITHAPLFKEGPTDDKEISKNPPHRSGENFNICSRAASQQKALTLKVKNNVEKQATEEKVNLKLSVSDHNAAAINKARARIKVAVAVINEIDVQIGKQSTQTSERIIINDPH